MIFSLLFSFVVMMVANSSGNQFREGCLSLRHLYKILLTSRDLHKFQWGVESEIIGANCTNFYFFITCAVCASLASIRCYFCSPCFFIFFKLSVSLLVLIITTSELGFCEDEVFQLCSISWISVEVWDLLGCKFNIWMYFVSLLRDSP